MIGDQARDDGLAPDGFIPEEYMGPPFRNVIFDLDGTLIDSRPGILGSLRHALRRLGHELPKDPDLDWVLGPPLEPIMTRLLAECGDTRVAEAVAYYREHYGAGGLVEARPYEGIPELLADLDAFAKTLFVATSKFTPFARRILDHFGLSGFFAGVYGTEPGPRVPSKAELIGAILADRQLEPSDTVVIGDREHDMIGARTNALARIGATYGYGTREELITSGADVLCDAPGTLRDLL